MDLNTSVIMPREDFIELTTAAFNVTTTPAERIAQTIQTTTVFAGLAVAFSAGCWAWYKAMSKLEKEKTENEIAIVDARANAYKTK